MNFSRKTAIAFIELPTISVKSLRISAPEYHQHLEVAKQYND